MQEKNHSELSHNQESIIKFKDLDDGMVAHSNITDERFCSGVEGENEVNQRIEEIKNEAVKNDAKFRIAKLYYEAKQDIESALKKVEEISNPAEQARCLIQLAIAVLKNEGNEELADEIFSKVDANKLDETQKGYLEIYKKKEITLAK